MHRIVTISLALLLSLPLAGCGGGTPKKEAAKGPKITDRSIYASANDCADGGKVKPDDCSLLIESAVKTHEKDAPTFKGLRSCEEASGPDRCEKDANGTYRMRLQAFLFEFGGPKPLVSPLYPSAEGKVGFRDKDKKFVDARDDNVQVSQTALLVAFENERLKKR